MQLAAKLLYRESAAKWQGVQNTVRHTDVSEYSGFLGVHSAYYTSVSIFMGGGRYGENDPMVQKNDKPSMLM